MWLTIAVSAFFMVMALALFELPVLRFIWCWCLGSAIAMWIMATIETSRDQDREEGRRRREFWERLNSDGKPK
jgi:hypothetical protein